MNKNMAEPTKNKLKKSVKQHIVLNPNTKFYFLVGAGIGFGIAGMALPPLGTIDWSVLLLIGQLLILAAAVIGISVNFDLKKGVFETDNDDDGEKEQN